MITTKTKYFLTTHDFLFFKPTKARQLAPTNKDIKSINEAIDIDVGDFSENEEEKQKNTNIKFATILIIFVIILILLFINQY